MKKHRDVRCKDFGYRLAKMTPKGKPEKDEVLEFIVLLTNAIAKMLNITIQDVMRWIRKICDKFITEKSNISEIK